MVTSETEPTPDFFKDGLMALGMEFAMTSSLTSMLKLHADQWDSHGALLLSKLVKRDQTLASGWTMFLAMETKEISMSAHTMVSTKTIVEPLNGLDSHVHELFNEEPCFQVRYSIQLQINLNY